VKPNSAAYRKLRSNNDFPVWHAHTIAQMRAHGLSDLYDLHYQPPTHDAALDFDTKQAWMYAVLLEVIQTPTGKALLRTHRDTYDARRILWELKADADTSVSGLIDQRAIKLQIATIRLDSTWSKSQMEFLLSFSELIEVFNDKQTSKGSRLTDLQKKEYLEAAVAPASNLHAITTREIEACVTRNEPLYSYQTFYTCLQAAAQLFDKPSPSPRHLSRRRSFFTDTGPSTDDSPPLPDIPEDPPWGINAAIQKDGRILLDSATWGKLSATGRKAWISLSDSDRTTIAGPITRAANQHVFSAGSTDDTQEPDPDALVAPPDPDVPPSVEANAAETSRQRPSSLRFSSKPHPGSASTPGTKPIADVHPGDPRRLLSPRNSAPTSRSANTVSLHSPPTAAAYTGMIAEYWKEQEQFFDALPDF
jgi:hypothetical protein